jgi:hypothetical protein
MCPACGTCCGDPWHGDDRLRAQVAAATALAEEAVEGLAHEWGSAIGQEYANHLRAALADPDAVLAQARAEALREHRHEWADYFEHWTQAVGPAPLTVELVIAALRGEHLPFGRAKGGDDGRA